MRGAISANGRVLDFLGIPYAAPPVGALRWRAPRAVAAWGGVYPATHYRAACAQPASGDGPGSSSEDCLYINVQRPALGAPRQRLPVYVYIHGGGLITGSGSYFNMEKLVRDTGVIGVTLNYRLGVFGFLAHPGLDAQGADAGNDGFLDQQAALRWVRRNIAAFGGNPTRVTLGGESAGGWSVCAHLVSPSSRRLFARAMIQSGSCPAQTRAQADAAGRGFAASAGCSETDPAAASGCLRALPAASLVHDEDTFGFTPLFVHGTRALPWDPRDAIRSGDFTHVPLLIGGTMDEGRAFTSGNIGWSQGGYESWVDGVFGTNAPAVLVRYPWPANAGRFTGAYLTAAVLTDAGIIGPRTPTIETGIGGCGTQALISEIARHADVYAYEWAARSGPGIVRIPDYDSGAGHAGELAYLWPSFTENGTRVASLFTPAERRVSNALVKYWGAFVKAGVPRVAHQTPWPRYSGRSGAELSFRSQGRPRLVNAATISSEHQCSFWDALAGR